MLDITTQELRRCDVVRGKGRIDSATVNDLKSAFETITEAGRFKIVFNMADVAFMSSAGLRQMIETMKVCKRFNRGDLILAEVPQSMKDVLELAGLTPIFKIYDTEVEAVGSF